MIDFVPMRSRTCKSDDGQTITYRVIDDRTSTQTLVFSGGLGGTHLIWTALARALRASYRLIIWDYPGLTASPSSSSVRSVSVSDLAACQKTVMDTENVERACIVGWSMGPQVALEFSDRYPDRISALVAICGVAGRPFEDHQESEPVAAALGLRAAVPGAVEWISERIDRIEKLKSMLRKIEHPTRWAKRLGLVDPHLDELVFDAVIRDFIDLDPGTYRQYVKAAAEHDASHMLSTLKLPVFALGGEKDRLVPCARVKELADAIPGASYMEIRGATHFLPLEYANLTALEIDEFIKQRVTN